VSPASGHRDDPPRASSRSHENVVSDVIRITVRPTFVKRQGAVRPLGSGFLCVGRLSPEKGVALLVSAWVEAHLWQTQRLVVADDGGDRDLVFAAKDRDVHYVGPVDQARVSSLLNDAAAKIVPSITYKGFPRTDRIPIVERGSAHGDPVTVVEAHVDADDRMPKAGNRPGLPPRGHNNGSRATSRLLVNDQG